MRRTRLTLAAAAAVATSAGLLAAPSVASAAPEDVTVQLLAMNDFHGRITPQTGADGALATSPGPDGTYGNADDVIVPVGGAAHVAATVQRLETTFRETTQGPADSFFVGAGDLVSASPFESSVFKDEPTIEALNAMGLDVSSVGNHEFDRGTEELRRISAATDGTYTDDVEACEGITPGVDGCFGEGEHAFEGAEFPYLAANVVSRETGEPMLPPYQVLRTPAGQRIALIGVVTESTPTIVSPTGVTDVTFTDEAEAVNRWVPELQRQGIEAIGVLVHEGGTVTDPNAAPTADNCTGLTGPIVDINARTSAAVDLIVSAHTHNAYNCRLADPDGTPRLVTQAGFYGRLVTDIRLPVDRATGDVDRGSAAYAATNVPVTREAADPGVQSIVDYWNARAAGPGNTVVGTVTGDLLRARNGTAVVRNDESVLGTFVANAQLAVARTRPELGDPVVAFMNPGGLRTDITAGEVTFRELFDVQPFSNTVNTLTLTGAAIDDVLEQQFRGATNTTDLVLSTSDGFRYEYDRSRPEGDRVFDCSITVDGTPVSPTGTYRVAANSFLAGGGDAFTAFRTGTDQVTGPVDVDTSVEYLRANTPLTPPTGDHAIPVTTPSCSG
ncbi:5'-nucleotidase [Geodermatophilus bullaregiensis]|uniref:bifunctional metallophosphatase/5'-nucleotidase n=1 Tax=Geodermatophilus bullaregiensis TaxID=1564160 RepID=UPI00195618C6|nr:bifunctional metallophosphatase/5'-nucleotidase [Geodermatophilus bullaregiensis]MBM7805564.1 5'-nucleotidase [Geodermatophilus bullaregiensis]